ncbi:polysaccharide deacetylase family protein [Bacillus luteolus]|uniref:Polysaccharide deacetylase family protein n=1 Tax=Litchfieldia luteola TaxID=682179 RepID=A0ABR9QJ76_9BACI|nr:polysaccharide deacetylase family protein [Cytobacillus luteolus]
MVTIGSPNEKSVILTFDDGPSRILSQILDVLKDENVPAMFFWQSRLLHHERPWLRVIKEGHLIGTHSINHKDLVKLPFEKQLKDIKTSVNVIEDMTGEKIYYFRPPFGRYNEDTLKAAQQLGLTTVMWRIASIDWELKDKPQQIICNVVDHLEEGAIILLHELKQTLHILPELIHAIRKKGYSFTTLPHRGSGPR